MLKVNALWEVFNYAKEKMNKNRQKGGA